MKAAVKVGGFRPALASWTVTVLFVGVGLLWLFSPLIWSLSAPGAEGVADEAPYVGAVLVVGLCLLVAAIWKDSNRESRPLGIAVALLALNAAVRGSFNINLGVELNYVLPWIVGMAAGGPMGLFVGAGSCLVSQFLTGQMSSALPGQMLVWGLAGVVGGALRPLGRALSCVLAPVLGLAFGLVAGVLLNLVGWPTDTQAQPRFLAGMSFDVNLAALVEYTIDSSLGIDLLRGITTAIGLAVLGYPLSQALRQALRPTLVDHSPVLRDPDEPEPEAIARRRRLRALTPWGEGPA